MYIYCFWDFKFNKQNTISNYSNDDEICFMFIKPMRRLIGIISIKHISS